MKRICLYVNLLLIVVFSANAVQAQPYSPNKMKLSDSSSKNMPVRLVPQDMYSNNLSFFCKKEWQVEKITKVPFRIRLGSLDYVNTLEGKGRSFTPTQKAPPKN